MAFDCFLKIDDVEGESSDEKHKDWIEILSLSHGISVPYSDEGGRKRRTGSTKHQNFTVVKTVDKASPILVRVCENNDIINEVKIELCRATGDKQKYMEYVLENAKIRSIRLSGSSKGGEGLPIEEVSFSYGQITWTHFVTDHKTGRPVGQAHHQCDLTQGYA